MNRLNVDKLVFSCN